MPVIHPSFRPGYEVGSSDGVASDLSSSAIGDLSTTGRYFSDQYGRALLMRGVSVSGISKLPASPNGFTHLSEGFYDHKEVSFVGRPFPLSEAHEHFSRLQQWGLTFIRFVVTWEALEHEGPGIYDEQYMDYLVELIQKMPAYGIKCYIDAHQDVWSRHTGGSGAPHWTLTSVGFNLRNLKATGAAHAHNLHLAPDDPPPKVWPSGYTKLAAATMATVFWAGDTFTPKRKVQHATGSDAHRERSRAEDVSLQAFLQNSMIEAFGALADKTKDLEAVIGFEVMNEPHRGYIQLQSTYAWNTNTELAIGFFPSAVQSWALGDGRSVLIDHYGPKWPVTAVTHKVLFSPHKQRSAWTESCIWKEHGLWAWKENKGPFGEAVALKLNYFRKHPISGKPVEWYKDFYWPFCIKFGDRMSKANKKWRCFVGPIPNEFCPVWPDEYRPQNLVYAPHWYDLQALFSKSLGNMTANVQGLSRGMFVLKALYFGRAGLRKNYICQVRNVVNAGYRSIGEVPIVLGETGVPFDLHEGESFKTGDYKWQERQLDAVCCAMEACLVSFNIWNYNPLNNHEWGDSWNGEDFSIFSPPSKIPLPNSRDLGEAEKLNVGARVLNAIERPYACKIAGIPLNTHFETTTLQYTFSFANPQAVELPRATKPQALADVGKPPRAGDPVRARETEVYLPRRRYANASQSGLLKVTLRGERGSWKYNQLTQTLYILHENTQPGFVHLVEVSIVTPELRAANMHWFGMIASIVIALAVLITHISMLSKQ